MYKHLSFKFSEDDWSYINSQLANVSKSVNAIADFTFERTYLRNIFDGDGNPIRRETKEENFTRVVYGTFSLIKDRVKRNGLYHKYKELIHHNAVQMYISMWKKRITPPGRGLWAMGTPLVNKDMMGMPLVNCTFITSENIDVIKWEFFRYIADTLMLGVGVGFDTKGAGKISFRRPTASNYVQYNKYYELIDQLTNFTDKNFCNNEGKPYILCEIDYINNLQIAYEHRYRVHVIQDSREGWCDALCALLRAYIEPDNYFIVFDYSQIRPQGAILKKFGGSSSGPKPLAELLCATRHIIEEYYIGNAIDPRFIIDIANMIARTVVAGNVRRSSEICLSDDLSILEFKNYMDENNRYRRSWGWASNNSYVVETALTEEQLDMIVYRFTKNGEPGIFLLCNARIYGRYIDGIQNNDTESGGTNPCGEISLEGTDIRIARDVAYSAGGETCNLVETQPSNFNIKFKSADIDWNLLYVDMLNNTHYAKSTGRYVQLDQFQSIKLDDEKAKLKELLSEYTDDLYRAHLYSKTVTLVPVHWKSTQAIQDRNRRIGISITGISVLLSQMGLIDDKFASEIADNYYDEKSITFKRFAVFLDYCYRIIDDNDVEISQMLGVPKSIKKRTVKPSGTVSICNDVPAGMHFPYSKYYIRRVRINSTEKELIQRYVDAGYESEVVPDNPNTIAISFPCKINEDVISRDKADVNLQFKILLYLQTFWADNQVSCTITFKEHEVPRLRELIWKNKDVLKGLSCFPYFDDDAFAKKAALNNIKNGDDERVALMKAYKCMPNERITEERYNELMANITRVKSKIIAASDEIEYDTHCDGDRCYRVERT